MSGCGPVRYNDEVSPVCATLVVDHRYGNTLIFLDTLLSQERLLRESYDEEPKKGRAAAGVGLKSALCYKGLAFQRTCFLRNGRLIQSFEDVGGVSSSLLSLSFIFSSSLLLFLRKAAPLADLR